MSGFIGVEYLGSILQVTFWLPRVFGGGIAFPFDKVLEVFVLSSVINDSFHFVFQLFVDKVWRRLREICSMDVIVFVQGEKGSVEYRVDLPRFGERETVVEGTKDFGDRERSFSFGGELLAFISEFQVFRF